MEVFINPEIISGGCTMSFVYLDSCVKNPLSCITSSYQNDCTFKPYDIRPLLAFPQMVKDKMGMGCVDLYN